MCGRNNVRNALEVFMNTPNPRRKLNNVAVPPPHPTRCSSWQLAVGAGWFQWLCTMKHSKPTWTCKRNKEQEVIHNMFTHQTERDPGMRQWVSCRRCVPQNPDKGWTVIPWHVKSLGAKLDLLRCVQEARCAGGNMLMSTSRNANCAVNKQHTVHEWPLT